MDIPTINESYLDDIKNKLSQLNEIEDVNRGGCAIVALGIYLYIDKNYPDLHKEIVFFESIFSGNLLHNIRNNNADSCAHAMIKIGNSFYDSSKCYNDLDDVNNNTTYIDNCTIHDLDFLIQCINLQGHWNPSFDRFSGVEKIAEILDLGDEFTKEIDLF